MKDTDNFREIQLKAVRPTFLKSNVGRKALRF
jgi:hypothetical protein